MPEDKNRVGEDERILRELQAELLAKIRDGADCGPFMAAIYGVPSDRVEALTGFDEGFKPDWTIEFARRGIEVVGPLAVEEGEAVHREYMRLQKTVYAPKRIGKGDVI